MVDAPKTKADFDNMSDDDFLKLDENDFAGNLPENETSFVEANGDSDESTSEKPDDTMDSDDDSVGAESDGSGSDDSSESGSDEEADAAAQTGAAAPLAGEGTEADEETSSGEQSAPDAKKEGEKADSKSDEGVSESETPAKAGYFKLPEGMQSADVSSAIDFFKKVSTPFKADGKDFSVRTPEDAIRLMQQGVNYSRRMQEIKPMKALNRVLQDNGIADQKKLGFAIDLLKGNKEAIAELLKTHKIDPMDLDTEKETGYQASNYSGNSQDNDFRDALDETLATPEGQALVTHINKDWDKVSKAKLREDPSILGNLQDLKSRGVYDQVVSELEYQRSIGYLVNVPFLQAFDQVGEAMKNAGIFQSAEPAANGTSMAPLGAQQVQPVASGARKSTVVKKTETNPHLSSTPPSKQTGNTKPVSDFDKMSDEDFLKMAPPS